MQRIWYPFKLAVDPRWVWTWIWLLSLSLQGQEGPRMEWDQLPALPNAVGVAGPFVGMHQDALIVAGGANFQPPVWESGKVWHDRIHVLTRTEDGHQW